MSGLTYAPPPVIISLVAPYRPRFTQTPTMTFSQPGGFFDQATPMFLDISEGAFIFSPISTNIRVSNATPGASADIFIDGDYVTTTIVNNDGQATTQIASAGVLRAGGHYVEARVGSVTVRRYFGVLRNPNRAFMPAAADNLPQIVAGADAGGGRHHWVLQDLAHGGIGSWVMPINPTGMAPLPRARDLAVTTTTSVQNPRAHVAEAHPTPRDWSFNGFCPDYAFYVKLKAYDDLNRRFYLIDHRNRAWTVTFQSLEMIPRKRLKNDDGKFNDWAHDYTVRATIYGQYAQTPA